MKTNSLLSVAALTMRPLVPRYGKDSSRGAPEETEGALVNFGPEQSRRKFLTTSAQASQEAADLAHQSHEGGVADFLEAMTLRGRL